MQYEPMHKEKCLSLCLEIINSLYSTQNTSVCVVELMAALF